MDLGPSRKGLKAKNFISFFMETIFEEALGHSRRKTLLKTVINQINLDDYSNLNFQKIYSMIYQKYKQEGDIGLLTIYDISSGICRHFNIPISKVFIIGKGPQRAVKILKLKCKKLTFDNITLKYIELDEIKNSIKLPDELKDTLNGDLLESFICKWQKNK